MSQIYCIRRRKKGKHLKYEDREELEAIIKQNNLAKKADKLNQRQIAERMGVSLQLLVVNLTFLGKGYK